MPITNDSFCLPGGIPIDDETTKKIVEKGVFKASKILESARLTLHPSEVVCIAEDIAQDSWVKVELSKTIPNDIEKYYYTVLRNLTFKYIKNEQLYLQMDNVYFEQVTFNSNQGDIYFEKLNEYINDLKPSFKEVINLYYFQENSYEEIAEILNITKKSVEGRLKRARLKLKEIILKFSYIERL